jgi:hypothetical protein
VLTVLDAGEVVMVGEVGEEVDEEEEEEEDVEGTGPV